MGAFVQQSLDDVDVHLVAVSANCTVAVDIPMTVDEVIHIAVIPLAIQNHILKIEFASKSNSNNSSATSCSVAKWVRCCFSSKKEKTF